MSEPTSQIKLSIVVPCYNAVAYIKRCMDSLVAQTLEGIEIIPVNDGSTDHTLEMLREYEKRYPGLVRVLDKPNGGLWAARWSGTDIAQGTYVAYVDSDDYVEPTFAEDFYTTAVATGADVVVCGFRRIDEPTGNVLSTEMAEAREPFEVAEDADRTIEINPAAWNKCFKRELLARINRLDAPPQILEDVALSQLAYLEAQGPIAFSGTAPYNYMLHEGSMINTVTVSQVESVKAALLEIKNQLNAKPAPEALQQAFDATVFLHLGISMTYRLSSSPEVDLQNELARTTAFLDEHAPTWRHNPYISLGYALAHGKSYKLLWAGSVAYKSHLITPLLAAYSWYLKTFNTELKW